MKWIWITLFWTPMVWAQNGVGYDFAIGLRAGETTGLTLKKSIGNSSAIEGVLGFRHYGGSVTVLYEKYTPAFVAKGLNWYYGLGGHAGIYNHHHLVYYKDPRKGWYKYYYYENTFTLGIDGILGLEYKIPNTPIAASLDIKPFLEFGNRGGIFTHLDPGLGIKIAL
jgi:hypothetical protein